MKNSIDSIEDSTQYDRDLEDKSVETMQFKHDGGKEKR